MRERFAQTLVDQGIGVMVAVIVIGAVAIPVTVDVLESELEVVNNETHSSSGSVPEVVQADTVLQGHNKNSEEIFLNDSLDNAEYKLNSTQYTADYEAGEYNVTWSDLDGDGADEINSTSDTYKLSYKAEPAGYTTGLTRTVLEYVDLALAVGLFVAAISLVR